MRSLTSIKHNPLLLCAFHALYMSLFPVAVLTLFFRDEIGLSVATIMVVQAAFGLVMAILEFPSGYLADRLGYRRALVLGMALMAIGWLLYALARTLWQILLAEIWLGAGLSLISGADSALLFESLNATGRAADFGKWYGRMRSVGQLAAGSAALLAGSMYAAWTRLPFVAEVLVCLAALLLARQLVEVPTAQLQGLAHTGRMHAILRHALFENVRLRSVIYLTTILALACYVPVWLVPLYARDAGINAGLWGIIWAGSSYSVAIASLAASGLKARLGLLGSLLTCVVFVAIGYLGLGLSQTALGIAFYFCVTWVRGSQAALLHHEEQLLITSGDRAAFVSLRSLVFRLAFVVLGPPIGLLVEHHGQHATYLGLGAALTVLALHGWWLLGRSWDTQGTGALAAVGPLGRGGRVKEVVSSQGIRAQVDRSVY